MRICRKCNQKIPSRIVIDGKERNLQNRKFCLNCSPFGSHNTKPDDPLRPSKNKASKKYADWNEETKNEHRARQYYYRQKRILKATEILGKKCNRCGYNKCIRALCFHHIKSENKKFELNSRTIMSHSWNEIEKEVKKCELLCSNCHAEHHFAIYKSKYDLIIKEIYKN